MHTRLLGYISGIRTRDFLVHANQDKPSFHIPIIPDNREVESTGVGRELRFPGSYGSCKQSGFHVSRSRI